VPLLLARRLPAVSPLTIAARFITRTSTLLVLGAALVVAAGAGIVRREVARERNPEPGQRA
jgi:hypothetical protein